MMRSFAGCPPSSSALSSSLFFISNTKPLHGHGPLLPGYRCHILASCSSHERFSTADSACLSIESSFVSTHTDSTLGRDARIHRHCLTVCRSYGDNHRETFPDSSRNGGYDKEPAPASTSHDAPEFSNRESPPIHTGYSARDPASARSAREIFDRFPSPGRGYGGSIGFNRDSPASSSYRVVPRTRGESPGSASYGKTRSYVRDYPARVDRLHEIVSNSYGGGRSYNDDFSSQHWKPLSHGNSSRDFINSPFKNATVSVFWDLDNKPPKSSPYHTALYLRHAASQFGAVVDMVAYANQHAFTHVPEWVREQRRDRKQLDILEQKGLVQPDNPYVCNLCGRKCKTNLLLKKHFKQLHEREHQKRMTRLNSLKGKKKMKYREAMQPKTQRYKEAASPILVPKVGYGLESDLRRAGILVKTVQYKPQAADIELKKQMVDSINKGIKCICLVSDDTDFSSMLADARALDLRTVVIGDSRSLKRYADFWFSWDDVSRGMQAEDFQEAIRSWALYHNSARKRDLEILAGVHNMDADVEHKVFGESAPVRKAGLSAFTEEEPSMQEYADGSSTDDDDDADWSFEDEEDELDDEWEDVDILDEVD